MDIITIESLLLSLFLIFLYCWISHSRISPQLTDWPVIRMTPGLLRNAHRIHDFFADLLKENNGTIVFKGPWLANLDLCITADPANIHYILSKNFPNYPKGPEFRKFFDILGDGIFNADSDLWELHRKTTMSLFNAAKFHNMLQETIGNKIEKGLIPILDFVSKQGVQVDLQEIFQRLAFDIICSMVLDHDPRSLSIDLPYIPCEKAFTTTEEAILYRHFLPESVWKLQSWAGIGKERSLSKAWEAFDQFILKCLKMKREDEICEIKASEQPVAEEDSDLLTAYMKAYKGKTENDEKFLRDTLLNLMLAGRDTTSTALTWFFWLLSKNPIAETKIQEEIKTKLHLKDGEKWRFSEIQELKKLVYLHGALCEALRLFPPVSLEHKAPMQPDVLPSGHSVDQNAKILLSFYSMGRMESIWGQDCLDFKPERWISKRVGIKHEPSYKFPAFNAGPRTCIGKEMAFIQMKIIATTIINNYQVQVVEGHPIAPSDSIILQMKYGLKVKLAKRNL